MRISDWSSDVCSSDLLHRAQLLGRRGMAVIEPPVRRLLDAECLLGEGPCWDAARGVLWFVDIKRRRLWHYDPATGSNAAVEAPDQIGWALPAEDGRLLCGLKDGLHLFDPEARHFETLAAVPGEPAHNRLNDGCTDPWGRVWFGSIDRKSTRLNSSH